MATEGVSVVAKDIEVVYQAGYDDESLVAEPAVIIKRYANDESVYGIIQGDQEITIGGKKSMLQLAKVLRSWGKLAAILLMLAGAIGCSSSDTITPQIEQINSQLDSLKPMVERGAKATGILEAFAHSDSVTSCRGTLWQSERCQIEARVMVMTIDQMWSGTDYTKLDNPRPPAPHKSHTPKGRR